MLEQIIRLFHHGPKSKGKNQRTERPLRKNFLSLILFLLQLGVIGSLMLMNESANHERLDYRSPSRSGGCNKLRFGLSSISMFLCNRSHEKNYFVT